MLLWFVLNENEYLFHCRPQNPFSRQIPTMHLGVEEWVLLRPPRRLQSLTCYPAFRLWELKNSLSCEELSTPAVCCSRVPALACYSGTSQQTTQFTRILVPLSQQWNFATLLCRTSTPSSSSKSCLLRPRLSGLKKSGCESLSIFSIGQPAPGLQRGLIFRACPLEGQICRYLSVAF